MRSTIQTRAFAHPEHNKKIIYLYVQTTPTREKKDKKEKKEEKKQPTGLPWYTQAPLLGGRPREVRNVVPRVAVQALLQALLINVVSDEARRAAQHKQCVERTHTDVFRSFLLCKRTLR